MIFIPVDKTGDSAEPSPDQGEDSGFSGCLLVSIFLFFIFSNEG